MTTKILLCCLLGLLAAPATRAQSRSSGDWAATFYAHFQVTSDIVYRTTPQGPQTLDVYHRKDAPRPGPTLFFIHGGGWVWGTKVEIMGNILPWLDMGWNVVSVNYRVAKEAPAPAALEDCLEALHWVAANAKKYGLDTRCLVIAGASAGGALALVAGMAPADAGLDPDPAAGPLPRPVAIVNFCGVVDVEDLLVGPHKQWFAAAWIGHPRDPAALARRMSPVTYVRPGLPPILGIQGDNDPIVPYGVTVRFHEALTKAGVPNQLLTIPGGTHGGFSAAQYLLIDRTLRAFLAAHGLAQPDWQR